MTSLKKTLWLSALVSSLLLTACNKDQTTSSATAAPAPAATKTEAPPELTAASFKADGLKIVEGTDYKKVTSPQPVQTPGKQEVLEFFWYGCPHCKTVDPIIQAWKKTIPADVNFVRAHVSWDKQLDTHQKIFYTLQSLNKNDALDDKVFNAIQVEGLGLNKPELVSEFMVKNGISKDEWDNAYNGFAVSTDVAKSNALFQAYGLQGVPNFIVNGKYIVGGTSVHTMQVINKLLEMERTAKK